jgi:DNA recombination protein RmuC
MANILLIACFFFGMAIGAALAWLMLRAAAPLQDVERAKLTERLEHREQQCRELEFTLKEMQSAHSALTVKHVELETRLESERNTGIEKLAAWNHAQQALTDAFKSLSADALKSNNEAFLDLARVTLEKTQQGGAGDLAKREQAIVELVKPMRESLDKVDARIQQLEAARTGAYATLSEQVRALIETQQQLRSETGKLVTALRSPAARGQWGEMQLRRVVEMAGMVEHCDFESQASVAGEDGRLRPDLLVRLPGGKSIVVDAKAPLQAYLQAIESGDEPSRGAKLREHAGQVRAHMTSLAKKSYWEQFDHAPEFVVLFLPGECFFSAALEQDPSLIEFGAERIILATPTTLIALLRAVAYGWRQENLAQNALEISRLGRELYKRLADMGSHWSKLGRNLDNAVEAFNSAAGTLERRVLVTARKFEELEAAPLGVSLETPAAIDTVTRMLQAPEMAGQAETEARNGSAALEGLTSRRIADHPPSPAAPA